MNAVPDKIKTADSEKNTAPECGKKGALTYLALFGLVSLGCWLVLRYVYPMGDGLVYGIWGKEGFPELVSRMWGHYHNANGRTLVHVINCFLLASNASLAFARVFVSMLCGIVAVGIAKLSRPDAWARPAVCVICGCGIFLLSVALTRQSVYWITGAMNYVFPLALFVVYWLCLRRTFSTGKGWAFTCVLGLITGATVEQTGTMAFGVTVLSVLEYCLRNRRRPPKQAWFALALSLAGILSVLLAPAVRYRVGMTTSPVDGGMLPLVQYNVLMLRCNFLFGETLFPLHMSVLTGVPLYLLWLTLKERHIYDAVLTVFASMVLAAWFFLPQYEPMMDDFVRDVPLRIHAYALAILVGYLAVMCYASVRAAQHGDITPLYAFILGTGSQVMMLVSPVSGPRTMLCFVAMMLLLTSCIIRSTPYLYVLGMGTLLAWHWGQAWVAGVLLLAGALGVLQKKYPLTRKLCAVMCCVPLLFCGLSKQERVIAGYRANAEVFQQNLKAIAAYDGEGQLILRRPPNELYGWVMPYMNEYYVPYFSIYYGLPNGMEPVWT